MAKIDETKEELNYFKVWLSIIVITNIGLISWLVNHYEDVSRYKVYASVSAIIFLTITIILIDKKIKSKIKSLRSL